jgi:streptogramin lyase
MAPACALLVAATVFGASGAMAVPVTHDPLVVVGAGSSPRSIAVGPNGEFYTANFGADDITGFDASGTNLPDSSAYLGAGAAPVGIARDDNGTLWTANSGNHSISRFVPGNAPSNFPLNAVLRPAAIAVDTSPSFDIVYAADSGGDAVSRIYTSSGTVTDVFAQLAPNAAPKGIVTDSLGNVYTANTGNSTISKITPAGVVTDRFVEFSPGDGPDAITIDSHGMLYVANYTAGTVVKIDSTQPAGSNVVASFTLPTNADPMGITVDSRDNVYVSESGPNTVAVIPAGSTAAPQSIMTLATNAGASGIAVSSTNQLLVTGFGTGTVSSLDLSTVITTTSLPGATVGTAFTSTVAATGVDPVTFSSADLPSWLQLDTATGVLTGTPTAAGDYTFSVTANSLVSSSAPKQFTVSVAAAATGGGGGGNGGATTGGTGAGGGIGTGGGSGSNASSTGGGTLANTGADASATAVMGSVAALVLLAGLLLTSVRRRFRTQGSTSR